MTATAARPHPLYADNVYAPYRLKPHTCPDAEVLWTDRIAYRGRRRGWQARVGGAEIAAVTWIAYFTKGRPDEIETGATLYVETSGHSTVFTLLTWNPGDRVGNPTKLLGSFTCPCEVNGLFMKAINPTDPFAMPLAEYLMERDCPPDILAYFW